MDKETTRGSESSDKADGSGGGGFGAALLACQKSVGFTQEELALAAGIKASTLSNLSTGMTGKPNKGTYEALLGALDKRALQRMKTGKPTAEEWDQARSRLVNAYEHTQRGRPWVATNEQGGESTRLTLRGNIVFVDKSVSTIMTMRDNERGRRISRRRLLGLGVTGLGLCALAIITRPGMTVGAQDGSQGGGNANGQNANVADNQRLPTISGWLPITVPFGDPAERRAAIAVRSMRTGEQRTILVPEASGQTAADRPQYQSYLGPLWSSTRRQLYYVAVSTSGRHDLWYTPLRDHGEAKPPDGIAPQPFITNCGPHCDFLAWSHGEQWLIYTGPNGQQLEISPDTGQQRIASLAPARDARNA